MDIPSQLTHSLIALIDGGSIVGVVVGVAKAFEWFDGMVSDTGRQALSNQLKNAPSDERIDSWATVFPTLIDKLFGPRALSLPFFVRSAIASVIAVWICGLLFFRVNSGAYLLIGNTVDNNNLTAGPYARLWLTIMLVVASQVINLFPDYTSLLVSRTIVRMIAVKPTLSRIVTLLIADAVLSYVVFMAWLYIFSGTIEIAIEGWRNWLSYSTEFFSSLPHWFAVNNPLSIFLYSSLFTSVWVWLYVGAIFAIQVLHRVRSIWVKLTPYLDIEKKPLVAIGRVAGLLAGAGYAVILGFIWISRHWH